MVLFFGLVFFVAPARNFFADALDPGIVWYLGKVKHNVSLKFVNCQV